jgi:hypothetical protein
MLLRFLAAAAFTLAAAFTPPAGAAQAQALQLVTADEAKLPASAATPGTRAITRGPGVKLVTPESVSGTFRLKVEFAPHGGTKIDPASVKVEYLRGSGVDLTARLKASIKPEGIEVASTQAPAGEHAFRVSVRDSEGREGKTEFKLTVK